MPEGVFVKQCNKYYIPGRQAVERSKSGAKPQTVTPGPSKGLFVNGALMWKEPNIEENHIKTHLHG